MEANGCVEIRFGVESGSDRVLELCKKGFSAAETVDVVREACEIFRRTDLFYVWGFPFETMDDFYQSVFQSPGSVANKSFNRYDFSHRPARRHFNQKV